MKVVLKTRGLKYEAEGDTVDQAIANLNLSWEQIKAKGVLTVSDDISAYAHLFYLTQLKRIFANKVTRLLWAKRLTLLLQEGKK